MIKDTDEQPDEEICAGNPGRVPSAGNPVPVEMGVRHPSTTCRSVHQPGTSLNPVLQGFLWRFHHVGVIYY